MTHEKKIVLGATLILHCIQTCAIFYGGQHWQNQQTGKNIYLFYEAHEQMLTEKNIKQVTTLIDLAKKGKNKFIIESAYSQTKQNPQMTYSILPLIHQKCVQEKIPVEDVDIRGAVAGSYKDGMFLVNNELLARRLEATINDFEELQKEIKSTEDPPPAQEYYEKKINELKSNPFFSLIEKTVSDLKMIDSKQSSDIYEKTGKKFIKDYLKLAKKEKNAEAYSIWMSAVQILQKHRDIEKRKNVKKAFPLELFVHMTNNEIKDLVDLRAIRSLFESLKTYDSVFVCAGGIHSAVISKVLKTMDNFKLVARVGSTNPYGGLESIDIKDLFA